jgi:putative antitoxin of VapBC-like toxin-antitoxin system
MRTTIRLDEELLKQAKTESERQGRTLTSFIDEALRQMLARSEHPAPKTKVKIPVSRGAGGTLPGVDINDSAALLDILEGRK